MRIWTRLVLALLLILPFTPALLHAADPEINPLKDDLAKLLKGVEKLQSDMTANSLRGNRTEAELRAIREELSKIRELLERMAQHQETLRIQAGYGPGAVNPAATPTTGTVIVQNTYSAPATVHINDRSFRVDPFQTRTITGVPVGPFQLFGGRGGLWFG